MEGNENLVDDIYMEFLECITNQLLYIRDIYPKGNKYVFFLNIISQLFLQRYLKEDLNLAFIFGILVILK